MSDVDVDFIAAEMVPANEIPAFAPIATYAEARSLTDRLLGALVRKAEVDAEVWLYLQQAWFGKAWEVLGYGHGFDGFEDYCRHELSALQVHHAAQDRVQMLAELTAATGIQGGGLPSRALAAVMGVHQDTAREDMRKATFALEEAAGLEHHEQPLDASDPFTSPPRPGSPKPRPKVDFMAALDDLADEYKQLQLDPVTGYVPITEYVPDTGEDDDADTTNAAANTRGFSRERAERALRAFVWRVRHQLSYADLALRLGVSESSISDDLRHATTLLIPASEETSEGIYAAAAAEYEADPTGQHPLGILLRPEWVKELQLGLFGGKKARLNLLAQSVLAEENLTDAIADLIEAVFHEALEIEDEAAGVIQRRLTPIINEAMVALAQVGDRFGLPCPLIEAVNEGGRCPLMARTKANSGACPNCGKEAHDAVPG